MDQRLHSQGSYKPLFKSFDIDMEALEKRISENQTNSVMV